MSQPIDWNSADVKQKTIYPSTDCFHMRLLGDTVCLQCGKPWDEVQREGDIRRFLEGQSDERTRTQIKSDAPSGNE